MDKSDRIKTPVALLMEFELFSSSSSSSLSSSRRHLPSFCLEANNCIEARRRLSSWLLHPRNCLALIRYYFAKVIMLRKLRFQNLTCTSPVSKYLLQFPEMRVCSWGKWFTDLVSNNLSFQYPTFSAYQQDKLTLTPTCVWPVDVLHQTSHLKIIALSKIKLVLKKHKKKKWSQMV